MAEIPEQVPIDTLRKNLPAYCDKAEQGKAFLVTRRNHSSAVLLGVRDYENMACPVDGASNGDDSASAPELSLTETEKALLIAHPILCLKHPGAFLYALRWGFPQADPGELLKLKEACLLRDYGKFKQAIAGSLYHIAEVHGRLHQGFSILSTEAITELMGLPLSNLYGALDEEDRLKRIDGVFDFSDFEPDEHKKIDRAFLERRQDEVARIFSEWAPNTLFGAIRCAFPEWQPMEIFDLMRQHIDAHSAAAEPTCRSREGSPT